MHWLMAHFIGDYLIQNDYMALNKKKSQKACMLHILTYMLPFLFVKEITIISFLLIAIQHYFQDRTDFVKWFMDWKGNKQFSEPPMGPWSITLTDNLLHIIWIMIVI